MRKFNKNTGIFKFSFVIAAVFLAVFTTFFQLSSFGAQEDGDNYICLSDMTIKSSQVGWGTIGINEGLDGNKIKLNDGNGGRITFEKGLCAHAASTIVFDIEGKAATKFTSYIGIHDGTNNNAKTGASVDFEVVVDGKSIYKSQELKFADKAGYISVDIPAGAKTLTLKTTGGANGIDGDHSAWGDPRLWVDTSLLNEFAKIEASIAKTELDIGKSATISLKAFTFVGNEMSLSGAKITYESLSEKNAIVDKNGKVTAVSAGSAQIVCEAELNGRTAKTALTVKVLDDSVTGAWTINSPNNTISVNVMLQPDASVSYSVIKDGFSAIDKSKIGMNTSVGDFSDGLCFVEEKTKTINEQYKNQSGKKSSSVNCCNEITLTFIKGNYYFDVIFRAYDDGFAFKYTIRSLDDSRGQLSIIDETSTFALPVNSTMWATTVSSLNQTFNYEKGYDKMTVNSSRKGNYAFPILVNTPDDLWLLVTEADLYFDSYVGSMLKGLGNCEFELTPAPITSGEATESSLPFTSPWRLSIVGELSDIVESSLLENVSTRRDDQSEDDWVEPGITSWMWLSEGFSGQRDYDTIIDYIDMASELGWKYIILDEGWQPGSNPNYNGYYSWFDDMIKYAQDKGVGVIVWILYKQLDTPEEREVLNEYANKGIKGIKCDFFDSEDQNKIDTLEAIYEKCYENKLLVIVHGANKPTGESQYWPNVISREAVLGEEYGGAWSDSTTLWPYLRGALGSIDITPRAYPTGSSSTTQGQQLAMCVVFENGVPCMAGDTKDYLENTAYSFYKNLPAKWDDIKFVKGEVGKYTVIARKTGDNWYIGGLTVAKRTVSYTLDFLDDGEYYCVIYNDDAASKTKNGITIETLSVTKDTVLEIPFKANGGYVVKLIKKDSANKITAIGFENAEYKCEVENRITLPLVLSPSTTALSEFVWSSSNEEVAIVDRRGVVFGVSIGSAVITVYSPAEQSVVGSVKVEITEQSVKLSKGWEVLSVSSDIQKRLIISKENIGQITLPTLNGNIGKNLKNIVLAPVSGSDFDVSVQLDCQFEKDTQIAGIIVTDGKQSVAIAKTHNSSASSADSFVFYSSLSNLKSVFRKDTRPDNTVYLKMKKSGTTYSAAISYDNKNWKDIDGSFNIDSFDESSIRFGVFACNSSGSDEEKAIFSSFMSNGKSYPITSEDGEEQTDYALSLFDEKAIPEKLVVKKNTSIDSLGLPSSVEVLLQSGNKATANITWTCESFYEGGEGVYIFKAQFSGVDGAEKLSASCEITVKGENYEDGKDPIDNSGDQIINQWVWVAVIAVAAAAVVVGVIIIIKNTGKKKEN